MCALSLVVIVDCGNPSAPSPFETNGAAGAGGAGDVGGDAVGGGSSDPTLGGPCDLDAQCNDEVDCTFDACDLTLGLCRYTPDDSVCQNEAYCDGIEECHQTLGCVAGAPVTCSDGSPCTINQCDEATDKCTSEPRDVDQDGDPDAHCGGGDCQDDDPMISSLTPEICANGRDDDCDQEIDEAQCATPKHDTCLDPLELDAPGTYAMNTAAAALDYSASCTQGNPSVLRDLVAAVKLPALVKQDVQLTVRAQTSDVSLALLAQCSDPASEIACSGGFAHPDGGFVAKVRGRSLGGEANPIALPTYVFSQQGTDLVLRYESLAASSKPTNETCGTAQVLNPSIPTMASIVDAVSDLALGCGAKTGELVYQFDLAATSDVHLYATSLDGDGLPVLSLRDAACAAPGDEITCNSTKNAHVFRHSLPAGTYFVAVAASAPTEVQITLSLAPPTSPPLDEDCATAPVLVHNKTIDVVLDNHQDDVETGCMPGGTDAAYALDLSQPSDVLLLARRSKGDTTAVLLSQPACAGPADQLVCATGQLSPIRAQERNLPAGSYRAVVESVQAQPVQLTALVRPAVPPTLVPFADNCSNPVTIPAAGGFFQGTTANAQADYEVGCDLGGQPPGGGPDQMLKIELPSAQRVVLDMQGSAYSTLLDVRLGPACPGAELSKACAAGYYPERSFLDLELAAGTYYVQIDGYAGQSGPWFLDVYVVEP